MLQHTESASTLDTCIRAILTPEGSSDSFTGIECEIELARETARVRIEFPDRHAPSLSIGQRARLQLDRGDDIEAFEAPAKAISWRVGDGTSIYDLHVESRYASDLAMLVGLRSDARVRVDFRDPVRAALSTPDGVHRREGQLYDLSRQGCAVLFEGEESWMLEPGLARLVHLELFPGEPLLVVEATLRTRRVSGLQVVYGFRLDLASEQVSATSPELADQIVQRFLDVRSREVEMREG